MVQRKAMATHIHQIYYLDAQKKKLDPAFIPYDNTSNPAPQWCEYHVFRTAFLSGQHVADGLYGYVSWKFGAKTRLSGKQFLEFIEKNPGYDVYFVNPARGSICLHDNIWTQGEKDHPDLLNITQEILDAAHGEQSVKLADMLHLYHEFAFCNYWVGNAFFWKLYMDFCEPVYDYLENKAPASLKSKIEQLHTKPAGLSYRPYIMERLLSTLFWKNRMGLCQPFKVLHYPDNTGYAHTTYPQIFDRIKLLGQHNPVEAKKTLHLLRLFSKECGLTSCGQRKKKILGVPVQSIKQNTPSFLKILIKKQ
jgi:hypothetical protein